MTSECVEIYSNFTLRHMVKDGDKSVKTYQSERNHQVAVSSYNNIAAAAAAAGGGDFLPLAHKNWEVLAQKSKRVVVRAAVAAAAVEGKVERKFRKINLTKEFSIKNTNKKRRRATR